MSEDPVPSNSVFDRFQWLSVPELAAFRSGRLANQIQHQTTVLWLLGYEGKADSSLGLPAYSSSLIPWRDLKIAGRHAIADQRQRMTFEQQVDIAEDAWKKQFQRIWHIQLLKDQNEQIEVDRQRSIPEEDGPSLREIIVTRCRLALGSVDEIIHSLQDTLLTACDAELLGMFQLGQHVDRLVHPVPAFAELLTSDSDALPRTAAGTASDQPATWGEFRQSADESQLSCEGDDTGTRRQIWNSPDRSTPWRLPRNPLPSSRPSDAWWAELASLAVASGLESSVLQQLQCVSDVDVNGSHSSSQRIVDRIEAVVTQSPTGATGSPPVCSTAAPPTRSPWSMFQVASRHCSRWQSCAIAAAASCCSCVSIQIAVKHARTYSASCSVSAMVVPLRVVDRRRRTRWSTDAEHSAEWLSEFRGE